MRISIQFPLLYPYALQKPLHQRRIKYNMCETRERDVWARQKSYALEESLFVGYGGESLCGREGPSKTSREEPSYGKGGVFLYVRSLHRRRLLLIESNIRMTLGLKAPVILLSRLHPKAAVCTVKNESLTG